jgi:hypothetical protein
MNPRSSTEFTVFAKSSFSALEGQILFKIDCGISDNHYFWRIRWSNPVVGRAGIDLAVEEPFETSKEGKLGNESDVKCLLAEKYEHTDKYNFLVLQ